MIVFTDFAILRYWSVLKYFVWKWNNFCWFKQTTQCICATFLYQHRRATYFPYLVPSFWKDGILISIGILITKKQNGNLVTISLGENSKSSIVISHKLCGKFILHRLSDSKSRRYQNINFLWYCFLIKNSVSGDNEWNYSIGVR